MKSLWNSGSNKIMHSGDLVSSSSNILKITLHCNLQGLPVFVCYPSHRFLNPLNLIFERQQKSKFRFFRIRSLYLLATSQNLVNHPFSLWVDLAIYSPSKFLDPSQVLRNALVYRKFVIRCFVYCMVDELWRFPSENHPKHPISGMGTFGVYYQNNIF